MEEGISSLSKEKNELSELLKESLRLLLYPFFIMSGGEITAQVGSLKFYLLCWLYGDPEIQHDGWIYPEEKQ